VSPDPNVKRTAVVSTNLPNPEKVVEELKRRAEALTDQLKRLEEAKIVKQETMQIEVSI
jgi:DNA-binding HxlR family transcriptional regulator